MPRPPKDAFQHAVALLSRRERTAAALKTALLSKGHSPEDVDAALLRAQQLGYLDDARVAAARARKELPQGRSRADVARRLAAQGVSEDVAETAAEEAAQELAHDDEAAARALIAKRRLTGVKAARLLAARGFEEDLIRRVTGLDEASGDG
ncbi:MAG: RecX family transcriptional regulator [Myxococcota bacterium]